MATSMPKFTLRPRVHQTFLLDEHGMNELRQLSEKRVRVSSERTERTVTMVTKRRTMELPRSSSRLSHQSCDISIRSSDSVASGLHAHDTALDMCTCNEGTSNNVTCTCSKPSAWYVPDKERINRPSVLEQEPELTDKASLRSPMVPQTNTSTSGTPNIKNAQQIPSSTSSQKPPKSSTVPHLGQGSSTLPHLGRGSSSSTLPRSTSSPLDPSNRKSWSASLPRKLSSRSLSSSPGRKVLNNFITYLFGCGSRKNLQLQIKDELSEVTHEMEGLDLADGIHSLQDEKQNPKSTALLVGKKKFNMDPKKGLEYLIEHDLLKNTHEDIAEFLYKGEGLSKRAIGDYLGERNDFNIEVLKTFVNLHEFSDMLIVQALRQFLWSFRLPGEAQKIDRMMECFAQRYCELNPEHYSSTDTCYVLSFAIIMLNTSLHNPAVKDKPSVERFIDMNRGINDGKDLPPELLTRIYDNIKKEPFKIPEDDGDDLIHTFFNPDKEGWLWKQGGRYKTWKRRWFLLKEHCLYYFEFTQDKEPKGIIPLENIQVRDAHDRDKPNCFELYAVNNDVIKACKTNADGKVVEGKHTVYRMSAATLDEKDTWMKTIRQSIKSDTPFYSILAARRKKAQHEK